MSVLRSTFRPLAQKLAEKPWQSPIMEFRYGLWLGVSCLYTSDGRQLGEENARPMLLNNFVPAQWQECKYAGSRNSRLINVSALRNAMAHFDEALAIVGAVRAFYLERRGKAPTDLVGLWDLYIVSRAATALIAYQARRQRAGAPAPIVASALASQFQFISGVFMICRHMMRGGEPLIMQNQTASAEQLYRYADEKDLFVSPTGKACAGSRASIMQFLEFCCTGSRNTATAVPQTDINTTLQGCVDDIGLWFSYSMHSVAMNCMIEAEIMRKKAQSADRDNAAKMTIYASIGDYADSTRGEAYNSQGSFESRVLARQNAILETLKKPPITSIPSKVWAERLRVD